MQKKQRHMESHPAGSASGPGLLRVKLGLDIPPAEVQALVDERRSAIPIRPELVPLEDVASPQDYVRLQDRLEKQQFRSDLLTRLDASWTAQFGPEATASLKQSFEQMCSLVEEQGLVSFGDLIDRDRFQLLVDEYDRVMDEAGSKSLVHSYVNLRNHPGFLGNAEFNRAFLHPLLIAVMAYQLGGPVRLMDARGKDAEPLEVRAQDNMLHIDNTPFREEYKILVKWERGKASGPKGQNFVCLPGTHKGARNCFVNEDGQAWSSENGSIFITPEAVDQMFELQRQVRPDGKNVVLEVQHTEKPLTTLFAAGALVHHRYRTAEGHARSCLILAFHRVQDNPGEFIYGAGDSAEQDLESFLFGAQDASSRSRFMDMLMEQSEEVAQKLMEISADDQPATVLSMDQKELDKAAVQKWKRLSTSAPQVEDLKQGTLFPYDQVLVRRELEELLQRMVFFDKHGPLDLILYADGHEETRKWARNRIREMKIEDVVPRLKLWFSVVGQPTVQHLLTPDQLVILSEELLEVIDGLDEAQRAASRVEAGEKISPQDAIVSIRQLVKDLAESIIRCENFQTFLSTALFLFWACDEFARSQPEKDRRVSRVGAALLRNYIATLVLQQLHMHQKPSYS